LTKEEGFTTVSKKKVAKPSLPASISRFTGTLVFTSSLVVMPPPEFWPAIVDIKKNHMNPRIKRPPFPHITLLQPFVEYKNATSAKETLTEALSNIKPFKLSFNQFKVFKNNTSNTLFLDPVVTPGNALQNLYDVVSQIYPGSNQESDFEAHIGVGFFRNPNEAQRLQKKYQSGWKPIDFTVQEIYILSRVRQDPFEVRKVITLGGETNTKPHFEEKPEK